MNQYIFPSTIFCQNLHLIQGLCSGEFASQDYGINYQHTSFSWVKRHFLSSMPNSLKPSDVECSVGFTLMTTSVPALRSTWLMCTLKYVDHSLMATISLPFIFLYLVALSTNLLPASSQKVLCDIFPVPLIILVLKRHGYSTQLFSQCMESLGLRWPSFLYIYWNYKLMPPNMTYCNGY